jgi:amino acid transporter
MIEILLLIGIAILFNNKASDRKLSKWLWILIGVASFLAPYYLTLYFISDLIEEGSLQYSSEIKALLVSIGLSMGVGLICTTICYIILLKQPQAGKEDENLLDQNA